MELKNLEELDVSGNEKIKRLPDEIGSLSESLMKFSLRGCSIKALPDR